MVDTYDRGEDRVALEFAREQSYLLATRHQSPVSTNPVADTQAAIALAILYFADVIRSSTSLGAS